MKHIASESKEKKNEKIFFFQFLNVEKIHTSVGIITAIDNNKIVFIFR